MRKILIAVDGSENSLRAVRHVIAEKDVYREPLSAVLITVQPPVVSGAVKMFLNAEQIEHHYREQGEAALAGARDLLAAAGIPVEHRILVGDVAQTIVRVAKDQGCAQIVMGTRGRGSVAGMILGSVATRVIALADVPVLLLK
ncbi:MAG: universal stress protein [Betaproteobacteria bacterium]